MDTLLELAKHGISQLSEMQRNALAQ
jgi:ribonuclease PH